MKGQHMGSLHIILKHDNSQSNSTLWARSGILKGKTQTLFLCKVTFKWSQ